MRPRVKPGRNIRPHQLGTAKCPSCGKVRYLDRAEARRAARGMFPAEALRAYRCGDFWHIGHTPDWVKRGDAT